MPGFPRIRDYVDASNAGRFHWCGLRKVPSQASTAGWWVDLSMAAGNPKPNYYASEPLVGATINGFNGLFHGDDKSPASKHLTGMGLVTPTAALVGQYMLCDYLLYYPFVDGDDLDVQVLDNTTTLPRYTDGDGVMVMAVAVAPSTGRGQFVINYTDHAGIAQVSPTQICSTTAANITNLVTSQQAIGTTAGPFLLLASGSQGVRSIESVQFTVANGGLVALVLVKPLADTVIREINTMKEVEMIRERPILPRVYDDAYLNLIVNCAGSVAAGTLAGWASFMWGE